MLTFFSVPTTDTSPSAKALQFAIQRAMTGAQRLLLALEMSLFARSCRGRESAKSIPIGPIPPLTAN